MSDKFKKILRQAQKTTMHQECGCRGFPTDDRIFMWIADCSLGGGTTVSSTDTSNCNHFCDKSTGCTMNLSCHYANDPDGQQSISESFSGSCHVVTDAPISQNSK